MLGIIRGLTDTFSMSKWNVVWLKIMVSIIRNIFITKQRPDFSMIFYLFIIRDWNEYVSNID
ncbi:phage protein [Staphylococcus aureus]|nr:phage protein [Staphylococcus aureus]